MASGHNALLTIFVKLVPHAQDIVVISATDALQDEARNYTRQQRWEIHHLSKTENTQLELFRAKVGLGDGERLEEGPILPRQLQAGLCHPEQNLDSF